MPPTGSLRTDIDDKRYTLGPYIFETGSTQSTKHFSWTAINRGRRSILSNRGNSYLKRENPWATLTKLRAFFGSTGSHSLEFHVRHAGKMVISSFMLNLTLGTRGFSRPPSWLAGRRPAADQRAATPRENLWRRAVWFTVLVELWSFLSHYI